MFDPAKPGVAHTVDKDKFGDRSERSGILSESDDFLSHFRSDSRQFFELRDGCAVKIQTRYRIFFFGLNN